MYNPTATLRTYITNLITHTFDPPFLNATSCLKGSETSKHLRVWERESERDNSTQRDRAVLSSMWMKAGRRCLSNMWKNTKTHRVLRLFGASFLLPWVLLTMGSFCSALDRKMAVVTVTPREEPPVQKVTGQTVIFHLCSSLLEAYYCSEVVVFKISSMLIVFLVSVHVIFSPQIVLVMFLFAPTVKNVFGSMFVFTFICGRIKVSLWSP